MTSVRHPVPRPGGWSGPARVVGLGTALEPHHRPGPGVRDHLRPAARPPSPRATTSPTTRPNIVYELLLGGILSATLVPVFVELFQNDDDEGASAVVTVAVSAMVAITVVALLAAPLIFRIYTLA